MVLIFATFSNRQNREKMSRIIPLGIYRCSIILPLPVHIIIPCISFFVLLLYFLIALHVCMALGLQLDAM